MEIELNKRSVVVSWDDLKLCMRAQFVPPHYRKELLLKLQRLQQGPSVRIYGLKREGGELFKRGFLKLFQV